MKRTRGRSLGVLIATGISCAAPNALANDALSVEIVLAPCVAGEAAALERVVQAELGSPIVVSVQPESSPSPPSPDVARVHVSCTGTATELEVQDPVTGKKLSRHVEIPPDLAAARARVLGLSIAELVAASWIELSARRAPPVRAVEATAPRDTQSAALSAAKRNLATTGPGFELVGRAEARHFTHDDFTAFGGALDASWLPRSWLALVFEVDAAAGSHVVSLGNVHEFLGSLALEPRLRSSFGPWSFEAGAGMRVGLAHLSGAANLELTPVPEQRSATLPWAGPVVALGASVRAVGPLAFSAVLEGGLASYRAEARVAGQGEFEIAGPWLGLGLGIGFWETD